MVHRVLGPAGRRDRKVSETRLTVSSDQDVVLDAPNISVRVHLILHLAYRTNTAMQNTQPMKMHEATTRLCELLQMVSR